MHLKTEDAYLTTTLDADVDTEFDKDGEIEVIAKRIFAKTELWLKPLEIRPEVMS